MRIEWLSSGVLTSQPLFAEQCVFGSAGRRTLGEGLGRREDGQGKRGQSVGTGFHGISARVMAAILFGLKWA